MDCKEYEKLIPEFIDKKLNYTMTKRFVEHLKSCPNCKEELNIQFLIEEGMARLEDGGAFDLQKEMRELLAEANRKIRLYERLRFWCRLTELLIVVGVLVAIVIIFV